jgi:hypothetical protein
MLTDNSWPSLARRLFEPEVKEAFAPRSTSRPLVGQLFFGVRRTRHGAIGMYCEIFRHVRTRSVEIATLAYLQDYSGIVPLVRASRHKARTADGAPVEVEPLLLGSGQFRASVRVRVGDEDRPSITASANLERIEPWPPELPATSWPGRAHNLVSDGRTLQAGHAFCPNCFGIGSQLTMSIPKADFEAGLRGKELYDANRLNGRVGCPVCGGAGGDYEPWYLEEQPQFASTPLRPGSGLIAMKSLLGP